MKDKRELCPNCGYYCTGKSAFCNQPIIMTNQNNTIEELTKEFYDFSGNTIGTPIGEFVLHNGEMIGEVREIKEALIHILSTQRTQIENEWKEKIKLPRDWRIGQTLFNFLAWLKENGYEGTARSSDMADPFYIKDEELLEKYNEYMGSQTNKE